MLFGVLVGTITGLVAKGISVGSGISVDGTGEGITKTIEVLLASGIGVEGLRIAIGTLHKQHIVRSIPRR